MATMTILRDSKFSDEELGILSSVSSRGDPKPSKMNGSIRQLWTERVHNCCEHMATFFKIGHDYDWESQYKEYEEFWENYFQGRLPA